MKKTEVKNYTLEKEEVNLKFEKFEKRKVDEDMQQIKCDMGFWCQVIKLVGEGKVVDRAKRELESLLKRLRKRGLTEDKIYRLVISYIKLDESVPGVLVY